MKVLLVTPPPSTGALNKSSIFLLEPLALEYLGAGIKGNHEVKLVDLRVEDQSKLTETIDNFKPDIIGSGACTIEVNPVKQLFAQVKQRLPNILTVVGGHHATMAPADFFDKNVDLIVVGEGVQPFKKICDYHEKQKDFSDIESIYFRKNGVKETNGKMIFTKKKEFPPLDTLPFPDRGLTSHTRQQYKVPFTVGNLPLATIRGSSGCVYRCNFCAVTALMNHKLYTREIDCILEELAGIQEQIVFWADDELFLKHERALTLAKEIDKAGIKKTHRFYVRTDHIVKNPECLEEWARVGLDAVLVGLESHRDNELKRMRKATTTSINEAALRICKANNVKARGNFIIMPDFDKNDFKSLTRYIKTLDLDFPNFSVLTPFPGTQLYEETKDKFLTHNLDYFDGIHTVLPTKLPMKQFYKELNRITGKVIPFKKKMKLFKQIPPQIRREFIAFYKENVRRLKNAYKDY